MNKIFEVKNLFKLYGGNQDRAMRMIENGASKEEIYEKTGVTLALNNINLSIDKGDIFVIIGLSGSGKSTLLRMFNMLNTPTSGSINFKGQDISKFNKTQLRDFRREKISMVFQSFGLMDHRSVIENIEYGLEIKGVDPKRRREKSLEMMDMVGLKGLEDESIDSLSGGMMQRVGIARALTTQPEVLLMDEPFSALDPLVRKDMQFELLSIKEKLDTSIIFITHDIDEAFKLADKIAILKDGSLIQVDSPENIIEKPANDYVRSFIEDADKSQVLTVENAMIRPNSLARITDRPSYVLNIMRMNGVSSAYIVDSKMNFKGIVTLADAILATKKDLTIEEVLIKDICTCSPESYLTDIMEMAVETNFPIAVLDDRGKLKGIISKVHVLTSLI